MKKKRHTNQSRVESYVLKQKGKMLIFAFNLNIKEMNVIVIEE